MSVTFTTRGALQKSVLRQANERLILNAVRNNPTISRSDLSRITGLSPSSISFIVNRLVRRGILTEEKLEKYSQVGRRPTALRLATDSMLAIALEIKPDGTRLALADLSGRFLRQKLIPWNSNPQVLAQRAHAAIRSMVDQAGSSRVLGVGVGLPGSIQRLGGRVIAAENLNWFNVDFGTPLRGPLQLPFYFENSARLSALAEKWFAEPGSKPLHDFIFIATSGGLGTGVFTGGHLLEGATAVGGECGHIILHPDGLRCTCGNRGCWEQYASDRALCRLYAQYAGLPDSTRCDAAGILDLARQGDEAATRALGEVADSLALGLANLLMVFNPEAIIVGDFAADAWDLIEARIWAVLKGRAPRYALAPARIVPTTHASDSALLGGASVVFSHFFTRFDTGGDSVRPGEVLLMQGAR